MCYPCFWLFKIERSNRARNRGDKVNDQIMKKPPQFTGSRGRKSKKFRRNSLFGLNLKDDLEVVGFETPTEHTPKIDSGYVFPIEETRVLLLGIQNGDRILITGHTGCLAGDTPIRYRRSGHLGPRTRTLENLYKKFNGISTAKPWRTDWAQAPQSGCDTSDR